MNRKMSWNEWYNLAKIYYQNYNNLEISRNFKTKDGYNYDENGFKLGIWVNSQRYNSNLNEENYNKLLSIGMRFQSRKKTHNIKKLVFLEPYKLSFEQISKIIEIPYDELVLKVKILEENYFPLFKGDIPNNVFFLTAEEIKEKYHISIEDYDFKENEKGKIK